METQIKGKVSALEEIITIKKSGKQNWRINCESWKYTTTQRHRITDVKKHVIIQT